MFEILDVLSAFLHESSLHIQSIKHKVLLVTWIYQYHILFRDFLLLILYALSLLIGRRKHVLQVSLMIQMGAVESFDAKTCYDHNSTMLIFTLCVLDANFAKFYKLAGTSMVTNLLNQTRQYYRLI